MPSVAFITTGGGPEVGQVVDDLQRTLGAASIDLSHFSETAALRRARACQGVFVISSTDRISLELARERAEWLRAEHLEDRGGLILWRSRGGLSALDAEEMVGLPVCGLLKGEGEAGVLARWIAAEQGIEGLDLCALNQALAAAESRD